jgi:hypothetical protein
MPCSLPTIAMDRQPTVGLLRVEAGQLVEARIEPVD